ncbi:MAG: type II secretion system F family protein, partial [Actinomycetota bacterium]|nr:type II secretion system F family protein [Actinomycetota bacterium]
MPKFAYAAIDSNGTSVEGFTKADTVGAARAHLLDQNLYPVKIEEKRGALQFELTTVKVKKKELMHFTRQLAVFVKAGIPLTEAMEVIGDETTDVALQRTITGMVEDLRNGGTLSGAASKHPEAFPQYYIGILGSAELTGKLDDTLDSLAGYLEREVETRSKVVSALSYPGVVMVLAMFTVAVLAGYVLPQFKPLFEELDAELPFATRALLFVADLFTIMWYIPFTFMMLVFGWVMWMVKSEKGKIFKDKFVLKMPVISGIVEYAILERFCRILGAMVKAGVPLPDAMRTTTDATNNVVFRDRLVEAQAEMMEGGGFAKPLARTELFPGAARQMFKVGEETGTLDAQLEVAGMYFD